YPIQIYGDILFQELIQFYGKAKIYWHAQGFGETEPRYMEHFGMTTVEAMASGCVPVVFGGGGQTEVVDSNQNGFLWQTKEELVAKTKMLVQNEDDRQKLAAEAIKKCKVFSKEEFFKKLDAIFAS